MTKQLRTVTYDPSTHRVVPIRGFNGSLATACEALRYLADHERPIRGEESFNSLHLFQIAKEIEITLRLEYAGMERQELSDEDIIEFGESLLGYASETDGLDQPQALEWVRERWNKWRTG